MSPPYLFRIDEVREHPNAATHIDRNGNWKPSTDVGDHLRVGGGVSGTWYYCNGQQIRTTTNGQLPAGAAYYKTFSVYYCSGLGFWILRGDATNPPTGEAWHSLWFDHDPNDYSSYLTNAGTARTLRCQRPDQHFPRMLLPDIYQTPPSTTHPGYGGLTGELAILLALLALSMREERLAEMLPFMFTNARWGVHGLPHGRQDQRGVVVYVYTCPAALGTNSPADELRSYEDGEYGKYYT